MKSRLQGGDCLVPTALAAEGLIDLEMLAQDGVRVRASAGASSFRRRARLQERIADVKAILAILATPEAKNANLEG